MVRESDASMPIVAEDTWRAVAAVFCATRLDNLGVSFAQQWRDSSILSIQPRSQLTPHIIAPNVKAGSSMRTAW